MTPEHEMKLDYAQVLQQLRLELDGLEDRRRGLTAAIAGLQSLVNADEQVALFPGHDGREPSFPAATNGAVKMPAVPPGFFSGKTPTEGYRLLMQQWPGYYRPPQIADLFIQGGMAIKTRTDLVQSIHSVLKRERKRATKGAGR